VPAFLSGQGQPQALPVVEEPLQER